MMQFIFEASPTLLSIPAATWKRIRSRGPTEEDQRLNLARKLEAFLRRPL
jgi:hypothetical protein